MFRPIRMDHTNCLQVAIKSIQFNDLGSWYLCVRMYAHAHGGEGNHIFLFRMTLGTLTHVVILEGNEYMDPVRYSVVTVSVIE